MEALIKNFLYEALLFLAGLVAIYAVRWLQARLSVEGLRRIQTELETKRELAELAVRFVEQVYRDLHGEEKFQKAAEWLAERARERGLQITADEIRGLIEATLRALKDQFGEEWAKVVKSEQAK